ncbi:MAG: tryptophan synthase subunit alpha [Dehalococcoidales bacterium]
MSRLAAVFQPGRKALLAYVTVGYPSIETTLKVVPQLVAGGADVIELGIPFSDPMADGATIQKASHQALENGVTPEICLEVAAKLSKKVTAPLVFMTYYNPVLSYGLEKFARECRRSGIAGLIIPDLPPEEGTALETITARHKLDLIYLLAPTSTDARVKTVADHSRGFIYLVSVAGVTGARKGLSPGLESFVGRARKAARQPLCVGFGISTPEQAAQVSRFADGVIVGSRILQLMEADASLVKVTDFVRRLRTAIDR